MPLSAQSGTSASGGTKQGASVTPPLMPTPPSMPTVSPPSTGAPYYTPGKNTAVQRQTNDSKNGGASPANQTPTRETQNGKAQSSETVNANQTQNGQAGDANRAKNESAVSAADLTALAKKGLLNNFYSLLGVSGNGALMPDGISAGGMLSGGITEGTLPSSSNAMLAQILSELADVKKQNAEAVKSNEEPAAASAARPGILRFIVNGYDILASCRTVYFSDVGADGTFLLTGDRTYTANGQKRSETFYLLFRPSGGSGFSLQYKVEGSVVQDYTNEHSFLYRLVSLGDLTAVKTGNLVSLRTSDPNCRADLLIDIGSAKQQ